MNTESLNLLPCPFCGGKFPSMAIDQNSVDVICIQCGVMMPSCNDEADAIGRWNERAEIPISEQTRKDDKDFLIDCLKTGRKIDLEDYNFQHTAEYILNGLMGYSNTIKEEE
jgi:Lar family restriction alleviation protein